jgi:hypothetical protein
MSGRLRVHKSFERGTAGIAILFAMTLGLLLGCGGGSGSSSGPRPNIDDLNARIARSPNATALDGVYTGGKGVIVRNALDGFEENSNLVVVPATFWVNDIFSPSQFYPNGVPECPSSSWPGCPGGAAGPSPFNYVGVGYVIGSQMDKVIEDFQNIQEPGYNKGTFYAVDSNSVDQRCRYEPQGLPNYNYTCRNAQGTLAGTLLCSADQPCTWTTDSVQRGPGQYVPSEGGGRGCHASPDQSQFVFDQTETPPGASLDLTQDPACQCPASPGNASKVVDNGWDQWVTTFVQSTNGGWGTGASKPSWALDLTACWHDNVRDMINLQNWIYFDRLDWSNQTVPITNWAANPPDSLRPFWGWNEIPVDRLVVSNRAYWDAVVIKLPAQACPNNASAATLSCVVDLNNAQYGLKPQLDAWYSNGYLSDGDPVVLVREFADGSNNFSREFFCENYQGGGYRIVSDPGADLNCYIERAN